MKRRLTSLLFVVCVVLSLFCTAFAADQYYVVDQAGLLTQSEQVQLAQRGEEISEHYDCGVYIVILNDYTDYGYTDIQDCAEAYYLQNNLGVGQSKDGELLMLSMQERDYALIAYGDFANEAFTDYGKYVLSEEFLDDFADDDWLNGFADYQEKSTELLSMAQKGAALDYDNDPAEKRGHMMTNIVVVIVVPLLTALVVCLILKRNMRSVRPAKTAAQYIVPHGVTLRTRTDMFTHTTQVRVRIAKDDDHNRGGWSGGTSINSGGFSGRSGKF